MSQLPTPNLYMAGPIIFYQRRAKVGLNVGISHQYSEYLCCACKQLLQKPVQSALIGHRYCMDCFIKKGQSKMACIECIKMGIPREDNCTLLGGFYLDKGAERDINKLLAECHIVVIKQSY